MAVEETIVTDGGKPRRVDVPVELPEGVSYEGVFGKEADFATAQAPNAMPIGAFSSPGIIGGVPMSRAQQAIAPPAPRVAARDLSRNKAETLADESQIKL